MTLLGDGHARKVHEVGHGEITRIVAETFVRMLRRDADSYLNTASPFAPSLASAVPGDFTVADLVNFSGVTVP